MRKTDPRTISELVSHAQVHPEQSYRELAASFGISEVSAKRYCATIGRGKNWRKDRKKAEDTGAARLWAAVDKLGPDDCWEWKGARNSSGYGVIHFRGKTQGAHRVAYELTQGKIPEGIELDHLCRNRVCCNPVHLEPINHNENMRRVRVAKAKSEVAFQAASPCLMAPTLAIDTAQETTNEIRFNADPTLINEDRLNPVSRPLAGIPVSTSPVNDNFSDPLAAGLVMHRELVAKREVEDKLWGLTLQQLRSKSGWIGRLHPYWLHSRSNGINVQILAQSEESAKAMFVSIWGRGYEIGAEKIGPMREEKDAATWLSGWRERMRQQFVEWKFTDDGKRCSDRVQAENDEKGWAEIIQQKEDRAVAAFDDEWGDFYRAKARAQRSSQYRRPNPLQSRHRQMDEPEDDEFEADEMEY
jgi:hypothetical protein